MRMLKTLLMAARWPSALAALLLLASPAAGGESDDAPPAPDAIVEVDCDRESTADAETTADEDSTPALGTGVRHWFLNDWSQGPAVFIFDRDNIHDYIYDSAMPPCPHPCRDAAGRPYQTIESSEVGEGGDFVLGKTARQITTGCVSASERRCPNCGTAMTPAPCAADGANPRLHASEPAKEIMDIREQVNPQIGLPDWEVDFLPGMAGGEDSREVMIHVIRRMDAQQQDADCAREVECPSTCPAGATCPTSDAAVMYAPQRRRPPHPIAWMAPPPAAEMHPEQGVVHMLRESSHQLDCAAHLLESQQQYERADQLREVASQLRCQAREAQCAIDQPAPPQPAEREEFSEAGLRDVIRELREELHRSRAARPYQPSRMER